MGITDEEIQETELELNYRLHHANFVQMKTKKDLQLLESLSVIGGEDGARTHDLLAASQAL